VNFPSEALAIGFRAGLGGDVKPFWSRGMGFLIAADEKCEPDQVNLAPAAIAYKRLDFGSGLNR
jgi:hypothetical protein